MHRAHTVSVAVGVRPDAAYAYISDPTNLPLWAPGFIKSIQWRDDVWIAQTTLGAARFRFAPANAYGILDHDVELPTGTFHNPMRVIPNGSGCEILFTLLQLPGSSDEQFKVDLETVRADLRTLRDILEQSNSTVG
ncbi:MAG TPA: SRPBCC family protein [Woeseiaceae bacterium]|jgi:hypothetical protein